MKAAPSARSRGSTARFCAAEASDMCPIMAHRNAPEQHKQFSLNKPCGPAGWIQCRDKSHPVAGRRLFASRRELRCCCTIASLVLCPARGRGVCNRKCRRSLCADIGSGFARLCRRHWPECVHAIAAKTSELHGISRVLFCCSARAFVCNGTQNPAHHALGVRWHAIQWPLATGHSR